MQRFDNSRALITGGSRGIGAAVARRLAAQGAAVTITYRSDAASARSLVAELTDAGHVAFAVQSDVTDRAATQAVVSQAAETMGGLDVLISNAGEEYFEPLASVSAGIAIFEHSLSAASKAAVVALARNLAPELAARNIAINAIAPGGTRTDMAAENSRHYTHPDLRGLPGDTLMRLHSTLGRLAEADEIAAAIAFLASPEAAYINGSTLAADGGWM